MSFPAAVTEDTRPTKPCQKFVGHTDVVQGVIHLPGGQQIMTCSNDGSLRGWKLQTGKHIENWQDGESAVNSIALSVDGKKVVSGSDDRVVRLWSIETEKVIAKWTGHTRDVYSVCWNRDGDRVLSGSWDGTARVWDVESGNTVLQINTGRVNAVYTAIFSPDSTLIATGGYSEEDQPIKIWDANTGKLVAILKGHTYLVNCLAWTADGRTLISGSSDDTIRTWNISTWQQLAVLTGHTSSVRGIAISPNGRILASASWDNTARLWDLDNGQLIGSPLQHPNGVDCVSFSTDGKLLATGCWDNNAYTWDVSAIVKETGLIQLLDSENSFLHADATRRPLQQPKNPCVVPTGFFTETPHNPDPDIVPPISLPIVPEGKCSIPLPAVPEDAPPEVQPTSPERPRFLNWLRRNTPARPTFSHRARLPFFQQPQRHDNEPMELPERPPSVVDVPLNQGKPMYYSAAQERTRREREKEKEKQARIAKKSMHANQSQAQPSSAQRPAAFTLPSAPANPTPSPATVSATPAPAIVTLQAGCLTQFLLRIGCVSVPHSSGHH